MNNFMLSGLQADFFLSQTLDKLYGFLMYTRVKGTLESKKWSAISIIFPFVAAT